MCLQEYLLFFLFYKHMFGNVVLRIWRALEGCLHHMIYNRKYALQLESKGLPPQWDVLFLSIFINKLISS